MTSGPQDKPCLATDNSPASPTSGRPHPSWDQINDETPGQISFPAPQPVRHEDVSVSGARLKPAVVSCDS